MQVAERAWVRLPSGKHLDLLHPSAADWDDEDLALGLARTYRWGGHSAWRHPLSVAQHSLTVMHLRRLDAEQASDDPRLLLRELLHDAEEGLLGFDPLSVLKPYLGEAFRALTDRLAAAVAQRYALPDWDEIGSRLHKKADRLAAASEALHVAGWPATEVRDILGITLPPLQNDVLQPIYGDLAWEPWPAELAYTRFLACLQELQRHAL